MLINLVFLASCGGKDEKKEQAKNSPNNTVCESFLKYQECQYKAQGMDDATIKITLDQMKKAWMQAGDNMQTICQEAIDTAKKNGLKKWCSL